MKLRVGVLQMDIVLADRAANREALERWLEKALFPSEQPTALVIPEIWDVGYALNRATELADPKGRMAAEYLGRLARHYGVWFVGGSVLTATGTGFVNRAQVVSPVGDLIAVYDKAHLIRLMDEDKYLTAGRQPCLFDLSDVRAGCTICYDLRFPEWYRTYALHGCQIMFVSAQWPQSRIEHWRALLRARAIENQMFVVACNRCGVTEDTVFGGRSAIIDPLGNILYEAGQSQEFGFATIDTEQVGRVRSFLTVFDDRAPEIYTL